MNFANHRTEEFLVSTANKPLVATLMTGHVNGEYRYISLTRLPDGKISIFSDVSDGNWVALHTILKTILRLEWTVWKMSSNINNFAHFPYDDKKTSHRPV